MYDLIVVGAGPGGYEAALQAGRMGKRVLLLEKDRIGGTCLNVGCIPTKTLLHSAKLYREMQEAHKFGVTLNEAAFKLSAVVERKNRIVKRLTSGVESSLKAAKVEIRRGEARILSKGKAAVQDRIFEGRNILIATGSRPAKPPIPEVGPSNLLDSTGILDMTELPASLTVIGGGVIGIEFASFFASVGVKVRVIEMLDRICPGIDGGIAKKLMRTQKKDGIEFFLSAKVEKIEEGAVFFRQKGELATVASESILMAVGRSPNVEELGLEEIGLDFDRRGIKVDTKEKTNIPGIWACGDVTGRCLLAHAAVREGQVAVNNMFGKRDGMSYRAVPGVVYSHPEVAGVGLTEEEAIERGIEYRAIEKPLGISGRFLVENEGKSGTCKVLLGNRYNEILGVHIIGGPCSEMIWGAAACIESEMRTDEMEQIIFPHPTIGEAIKETIIH